MTNLEKLEKEIRLNLRLRELREGCIVKFTDGEVVKLNQNMINQMKNVDYRSGDFVIIGHEIKLNDVLEWFRNKLMVNNGYVTISFTDREGFIRLGISSDDHHLIGDWDLPKNLLKDQSQELIDSLSGLLK